MTTNSVLMDSKAASVQDLAVIMAATHNAAPTQGDLTKLAYLKATCRLES